MQGYFGSNYWASNYFGSRYFRASSTPPPPPPPPPGYQQRGLGAIVLTDPSKLTKKKKRRVRLALRGQLLFPADVADQQTIEDDWLLFGIDLIDSELFDELGTL